LSEDSTSKFNVAANYALFCRLWLLPAATVQRQQQQQQQQIICFEDFLPAKDAVVQDLVTDVNKKLGQKHINGSFSVQISPSYSKAICF